MFDKLVQLQELNLQHNLIATIGLHVFLNTSNLHLQNIDLSENRLTEIETWIFFQAQVCPGVIIKLNNNLINRFTNFFNWRYTCSMPKIIMKLDFSHNRIQRISDFISALNFSQPVDAVCFLTKKLFMTFDYLSEYICDCMDYEIFAIWQYNVHIPSIAGSHTVCTSHIQTK